MRSICRKIHFFAPKITENGRFWVQKNGTWDAEIQKERPLFVTQCRRPKVYSCEIFWRTGLWASWTSVLLYILCNICALFLQFCIVAKELWNILAYQRLGLSILYILCNICAVFFAISHRGQRVVKFFGRQVFERLGLNVHSVCHIVQYFFLSILHHSHCFEIFWQTGLWASGTTWTVCATCLQFCIAAIVVKYFGRQACKHLEICRLGKRGMARKPFSVVNHIWTQDGCECE